MKYRYGTVVVRGKVYEGARNIEVNHDAGLLTVAFDSDGGRISVFESIPSRVAINQTAEQAEAGLLEGKAEAALYDAQKYVEPEMATELREKLEASRGDIGLLEKRIEEFRFAEQQAAIRHVCKMDQSWGG